MLLASAVIFATSASAAPCVNYGTGTIEGTLVAEQMLDPATKKRGWWFFVELKTPICINAGNHPKGFEPALQSVTKIQLIHPDKTGFEQTSPLKGQSVTCLGTLFGKWTENHYTPVLMRGTCLGAQQGVPADRPRPAGSAGG